LEVERVSLRTLVKPLTTSELEEGQEGNLRWIR